MAMLGMLTEEHSFSKLRPLLISVTFLGSFLGISMPQKIHRMLHLFLASGAVFSLDDCFSELPGQLRQTGHSRFDFGITRFS